MNNNTLQQQLAEAEQPVKNFMADLLEILGKKASNAQDPQLALSYFGAQLEIRLVSFDGDKNDNGFEE
ncbi:hypothetical protein [Vibrio mexicanus]|uniref:hypothetical protein n=1 Tax=Vibrio mexicanus TaxID=1004326 RepID=UPI00063C6018|nr:hypothetical protein [Vibrio mexicanus]